MAKKCKPELSDRCFPTINARCVDYEGILRENSTLDEDDCLNVEEVIEDLTVAIDQTTEDLNFSEFGCCLEYEVSDSDRGLTLKDVVGAHESLLCDIVKRLDGEEVPENCNNCGEENCEDDTCCEILKKFDAYSTTLNVTTTDWLNSTATELQYKATKTGTYKFTFELGINASNQTTATFNVGLSLNGFAPLTSLFSQVLVTTYNSNTVTFVVKMQTNDIARFSTKKQTEATYVLNYVKMIVEKIK